MTDKARRGMDGRIVWILSLVVAAALATSPAVAATVNVDAAKGSDEGDGSAGSPLKTIERALKAAAGGDTVVLAAGEYDGIVERGEPGKNMFTDWVTIRAAEGAKVAIKRVQIGVRAGNFAGPDGKGSFDVYLRIEGPLTLADGVYLFGGRHLEVIGCRIERIGPWTGSEENIEKAAVSLGGCSDVLIKGCDITNTGVGVMIGGTNCRVVGNHIHDITHDGIRCIAAKDSLIEGNHIHNLDDGVDDGDPVGEGWNRHCDGIHIFIAGPGKPGMENANLVFRGNVIYDCESQGIQFNNYLRSPDVRNKNLLFENNVFGPTRANAVNEADPVDGFIFRNNTFVVIPGGRSFGRIKNAANSTLRVSEKATGVQVYNNILANTVGKGEGWFVDYNLIQSKRGTGGRFEIFTDDPLFVEASALDGKLKADSPAINAGTRKFAPSGVPETDRLGTPRDVRPDMGAFELVGQSPEAEANAPQAAGPITAFVDDFTDGDASTADRWLAGQGTEGLAWTSPQGGGGWFVEPFADGGNALSPPRVKGPKWLVTVPGADWADYDVEIDSLNAYLKQGSGVAVLYRDPGNCYLLDLAAGKVIRRTTAADGTVAEKEIASSGAIALPNRGLQKYRIGVRHGDGTIAISVDAKADGSVELTATEDEAEAAKAFAAGRVALYNDSPNGSHRTNWDNVKVTVTKKAAEEK